MSLIKKILLGLGVFLGSVAIFLVLVFVGMYFYTGGLKKPIEQQLIAIQTEEYAAAYSYTSTGFQNTTSFEAFKKFVNQFSALRNNKGVEFEERSIENGVGTVSVELLSRSGAKTPAKYQLVKENDKWKIQAMILNPVDAGASETVSKATLVKPVAHEPEKEVKTTNEAPQPVSLTNYYQNSQYHFGVYYPANWIYTTPQPFAVLFTPTQPINNFMPTIRVQKEMYRERGGRYRDIRKYVNDVMANLLAVGVTNLTLVEQGPVPLGKPGQAKLNAQYSLISYSQQAKEYNLVIVLYYKDPSRTLYILEFSAPKDNLYDVFPVAKAMAESFSS
jgi:hypothetical protein